MLNPYQAKYIAFELTKRFPSGSNERFNMALMDAQVDLNPHQVEAALFAFKSPLSKGAILADEVGLGKTIEAGILLSQLWAERRTKLLIICPANLRKQWSQELYEKFFLESIILENKNFNELRKAGRKNPFENDKIVICSYQFARSKADMMQLVSWDLAVIDEAHRLRNVYKPSNKIGNAIKEALSHARKALLTATPLQNSLLELYGLVSIIDEHTFGDIKSFRSQFLRTVDGENYQDLRDRLKSVCIRNLRRQVQEYIRYTNRIPLTIKFEPSDDEQKLYEDVSDYLQRDLLYALPAGQRHLMTLILRKLLASSSFAIAGTLNSLIKKLNQVIKGNERKSLDDEIAEDYELFEEQEEEWNDDDVVEEDTLTEVDIASIRLEIQELEKYRDLAESIKHNSKGEKLLTALKEGFSKMDKAANRKAIIFTESTRTQNYLLNLLSEHYPNKIVLFNGSNNDELSNKIYKNWLSINSGTDKISGSPTSDKRAALVDYFKNEAVIMIATEAASEGINLQFCSLLINYDLPWNPQRIEQRIGRCHRYGQKFDVVVVNFLNIKNAADIRVFQLLDEKFKLFSGVFGASDDVLGSIESGVDFEKRIAEIYQKYRTETEIIEQFDILQKELDEQINSKMLSTRETLLANFDDEVLDKLKIRLSESREYINKYEQWLWAITQMELHDFANFDDTNLTFQIHKQPYQGFNFPKEPFKLGKPNSEPHVYRIGHPLAQHILEKVKDAHLKDNLTLTFNLTQYAGNVSILEELKNQSGWLSVMAVSIESFETSDYLLTFGYTNSSLVLSEDQAKRLLTLPVSKISDDTTPTNPEFLENVRDLNLTSLLNSINEKDSGYLKFETEKLNKWADDRINAAELAIKETKARIKELTRESQKVTDPTLQLKIQEQLQELNRKQKKQRQEIFIVEDEIAESRDKMIADIQKRMKQQINKKHLFTINWKLL